MFVSHIFATSPSLPPIPDGLYQYVVAANGTFVRAKRPGLEAQILITPAEETVRGLVDIQAYVKVGLLVDSQLCRWALLDAWRHRPNEALYYLSLRPRPKIDFTFLPYYLDTAGIAKLFRQPNKEWSGWKLTVPPQFQSPGGVRPIDPYGSSDVLLEMHSHHDMRAYFSAIDDRDERGGFRLYAVIGRLGAKRPEILVRVGIYGHFMEIPARWVFDMPEFLDDVWMRDNPEIEKVVGEPVTE